MVLGWKIFSHLRFRRWLLRGAAEVSDPAVLAVWQAELEWAGEKKPKFRLVTSPQASTPITIGLFPKSVRVVLPQRHYTPDELKLIFRHELVHIGREDAWNKFFVAFCIAMCWFNPLMWMAMGRSSEDLELSCDETVLSGLEEGERRRYADLILRTAGDGRGFTTCLSASASALRYRLKSIVTPGKKASGALLVGAAFILLYFQPVGSAEKYPQIMHFGILAIAGDDILSPQTEAPFSYPCGTVRSMQRGASPLCVFIVEPDAGLSADFEAGYDV